MRYNCLAAICCLAIAGCSHGDVLTVAVDIDGSLAKTVSIFDMFSKVELVELKGESPISNSIYNAEPYMACSDECLYVLDERLFDVHIFDHDGNLLKSVAKRGRGPGEFTMACQIHYNEDLELLEILNPMGRILRYSPDMSEFESEMSFSKGLRASHNYVQSGGCYILYSSSEQDKLWRLIPESESLTSFGYRPPRYLVDYIAPQSPFLRIGDKWCFMRAYDGLIYMLDMDSGEMSPYIAWDFGGYQCRLDDIPKNVSSYGSGEAIRMISRKRVSPFVDMKSAGDKIFANVVFNGRTHTLCHDLATGQSHFFEKTSEGMLFLTELFHEGVMYKYIDAGHLREYVNRGILDAESQRAYDSILSGSGQGLIKYYL